MDACGVCFSLLKGNRGEKYTSGLEREGEVKKDRMSALM